MTTARFAWPQYRRQWALSVRFDEPGIGRNAPVVDAQHRRIQLTEEVWEEVVFDATMTSDERPPAEGQETAYLLISSSRSNTRIPYPMSRRDHDSFSTTVRLRRDMLSGTVDLVGQIVRIDNGVAHLVGESEAWAVVVDASSAPPLPGAPPFQIAWASFSSDSSPATLRPARGSYAAMDFSGAQPVLYLNEDVKGLRAILESAHAKLEKRRLRDTLSSGIARYAVASLLREALSRTYVDDESVQLPDDELLRQVCEVVAGTVDSVADVDEFCRIAKGDGVSTAPLWVEIDSALDRLTNHAEYVATATEEVHFGRS